jgi:nucleoid-associated protein YgaU
MITLVSRQPALQVRALRGNTPPVPVGGFGGWQLVARPRRKSLTRWTGIEPFKQQLSIILDGVTTDTTVEPACLALERMAQPAAELADPPLVKVVGAVPHPELTYVIGDGSGGDGLAWDANPIYSPSGYRIRQEVVITLLEYVPDDRVAAQPAAAQARQQAAAASSKAASAAGGTTPAARTYTVKSGDSLTSIAARQLGAASRWLEIAQLNGLHDPYTLTVGQQLRMP